MQKANPMYVSKSVREKCYSLLSVLNQSADAFASVASSIPDKNLKRTINGIAIESKQYAQELSAQLQSLGIEIVPKKADCKDLINNIKNVGEQKDTEKLITAWNKSENFFIRVYRDVLNEYFPFESLRRMIAYQLNGIKCEFMKMRLLNGVSY